MEMLATCKASSLVVVPIILDLPATIPSLLYFRLQSPQLDEGLLHISG